MWAPLSFTVAVCRMKTIVTWKLVLLNCSPGHRPVCRQNLVEALAAQVNADQPHPTAPRYNRHHHVDVTGGHTYAHSLIMTPTNRWWMMKNCIVCSEYSLLYHLCHTQRLLSLYLMGAACSAPSEKCKGRFCWGRMQFCYHQKRCFWLKVHCKSFGSLALLRSGGGGEWGEERAGWTRFRF